MIRRAINILLAILLSVSAAHAGTAASLVAASSGYLSTTSASVALAKPYSFVAYVQIPDSSHKGVFVNNGISGQGSVIGFGASGSGSFDSAGDFYMGLANGIAWITPTGNPTLTAATWLMVAYTITSGNTIEFYVSGGPGTNTTQFAGSATPGANSTPCFYIGANEESGASCNSTVARFATALIAKVSLFNVALSQTTLNTFSNATTDAAFDSAVTGTSGLVGYWKLQDTAGSATAADSSGNGLTLTVHNTGTGVIFGQAGPLTAAPTGLTGFFIPGD